MWSDTPNGGNDIGGAKYSNNPKIFDPGYRVGKSRVGKSIADLSYNVLPTSLKSSLLKSPAIIVALFG